MKTAYKVFSATGESLGSVPFPQTIERRVGENIAKANVNFMFMRGIFILRTKLQTFFWLSPRHAKHS